MAIFKGATAPGIWKGREDLGVHLGSAESGIIVGAGGGAAPPVDPFAFSLEFNAVDTGLVIANALPAGESHIAMWLKWNSSVAGKRAAWGTSDGLASGVLLGGGVAQTASANGRIFVNAGEGGATVGAFDLWELWVWTRDGADNVVLDTPDIRVTFPGAPNPAGADEMSIGYSSGFTSPRRIGGKIARWWVHGGAGSFVTAGEAAAWRADWKQASGADHEWNPGTAGDTTALIQDVGTVGGWDAVGAGGLILGTDVPA